MPGSLSFLVDSPNYLFGAIFNLADAYISVAVVYLLIFQYKFFREGRPCKKIPPKFAGGGFCVSLCAQTV